MSKAWEKGSSAAWRRVRKLCLERDGFRCQIKGPNCTTVATTADHIVPRSVSDDDSLGNLRAACATCNTERGDRPDDPPHAPVRW